MSTTRLSVAALLVIFGISLGTVSFAKEKTIGGTAGDATKKSCEDIWGECRKACMNEDGRLLQAACKRDCDDAYTQCIRKEGVIQRGGASKVSEAAPVTSATPKKRLLDGNEPVAVRSPNPAASPLRHAAQLKDVAAATAEASAAPKRKPTPTPSPHK